MTAIEGEGEREQERHEGGATAARYFLVFITSHIRGIRLNRDYALSAMRVL
jgi:hypothetical protein